MRTKDLIERLKHFLDSLEKHKELYFDSLESGRVVKNYGEIEKQEHDLSRQFGTLEPCIRKFSDLKRDEPATGTTQDLWDNALAEDLPLRKAPALRRSTKELNRIIGQLETIDTEQILLEDLVVLFDSIRIHPEIIRVSKRAFENKMYADAILSAYKEVIVQVRKISRLHALDGTKLMDRAFSLDNPEIKLNNLQTQSEKDEQAGFLNIFKGVVLGVRNPKAHENIEQKDPYKTLEYLSLASLLMKKLDERIEPK